MMTVDFSLYLITARHKVTTPTLQDAVEAALQGGVRAVQLREKDLSSVELYDLAVSLRRLTSRYQAKLLINDRVDIALAVDADGVHLTEHSLPVNIARQLIGPDRLLAVSTHHLDKALSCAQQGADFITFSPIYDTPSKLHYGPPQGLERLREVCRRSTIPVFALGGITAKRWHEVQSAGAQGCAVISAIIGQQDPKTAAETFLSA